AGCGSSTQTVSTIGGEILTLEEFEHAFQKHNGGWEKARESTQEERERFLDLLVKFRLKVREAREQGLASDSAVQSELNAYRTSVASTYMLEKELVEPGLKKMYDRKRELVRSSHIMFRVPPDANPAETLAVYSKAMDVLRKTKPSNFDSLAVVHSEEPNAHASKGDLGYFSMGKMVPAFEDAAYDLKVGEISGTPLRTQFGYHIIHVTDRRSNDGVARVAHILRRSAPDGSDSAAVRDTVMMIYQRLQEGWSFTDAAREYSHDTGSGPRGGELGSFGRDQLPPEIGNIFFTTPVGTVAPPYRASYGYHIFHVIAREPVPPYESMERDLRQRYQQNRYAAEHGEYVHRLKKEFGLVFDIPVLHEFARSFDSTKTFGSEGWADHVTPNAGERNLFSYDGKIYRVRDFIGHINVTDEFKIYLLKPSEVERVVERLSEAKILESHADRMAHRFPQLGEVMKEYRDGILLYRIEQDEVWGKVSVTDSLLRIHYEATKENYRWPRRVNVAEIQVKSDSLAQALRRRIQSAEDFLTLAEQFTERSGYREKRGVWGLQPVTANELTRRGEKMAADSVSDPFSFQAAWSIIKVLEHDSARVKTFEEALPEVTSGYQEVAARNREEEWINQLRQKYGVTIDRSMLARAFTRTPRESRE
ncbi:MAG: peptidylprolyl isomerase, partial [Bacteroidota bacterium]